MSLELHASLSPTRGELALVSSHLKAPCTSRILYGASTPHRSYRGKSGEASSAARTQQRRLLHTSPSPAALRSRSFQTHQHTALSFRCSAAESAETQAFHVVADGDVTPEIAKLVKLLEKELPRQYDEDFSWEAYDDSVAFADPATLLQGKVMYRGMIVTLRVLAATAMEPGTAEFLLHSMEVVTPSSVTTARYPPKERGLAGCTAAIRTVWTTLAKTRWGKTVKISGDDIFRINNKGRIFFHESAWNESPQQVWEDFRF